MTQLRNKGDVVTLDDIKLALKLRWRLKNKGEESDEPEGETALMLNDNQKCARCGKKGHDAAHCWANLKKEDFNNGRNSNGKKKVGGKSKRFKGKCNLCGKKGHKESDCL